MLTSGNVTFTRCPFLASSMYFFGDHAKGLLGGGGEGGYKSHTGYVPPHRVGFLRRNGLKTGLHFALILVWNRVLFSRELRSVWTYFYRFNQMSKKEREICKFEMDLNNFFVCAII